MSFKVAVHYAGVQRTITAKSNGKTHTFSELWVKLDGCPYPQLIDSYGSFPHPAGDYIVPLSFEVDNKRISARLDVAQAVPMAK